MRYPLGRKKRRGRRMPLAACPPVLRGATRRRRLAIEPLEARQLLDSAGWQNPDKALDVDKDRFIVGMDALAIVNRLNSDLPDQLTPLSFGEVPEYYYDTNDDGFCTAADLLLVVARLNLSSDPPAIAAALAVDTGPGGVPNSDAITSNPAIAGQVTDVGPLSFFTLSLNGGPDVDVLDAVQPNGSFTFSQSRLEQLNDGPLTDRTYVLRLHAVNEIGYPSEQTVAFVLDRAIATPPLPDLPAAFDTGTSNFDNITKVNTPQITVGAESGSTVTLFVDGAPVLEQIASPSAVFDLSTLADGEHQIVARAVDGAGNQSSFSNALKVTIRTVAPQIEMITVPFQDDLTPLVKAVVTSTPTIADATPIVLDIDRNFDGDYDDADELATASAQIYGGKASVQVTKALPNAGLQAIKLRMRVTDLAGNEGVAEEDQTISTLASTVLKDYVNKNDGAYKFELLQEGAPNDFYRVFTLRMTSQRWRTDQEVDKPTWQHWVTIFVPKSGLVDSEVNTALLFITGGSNTAGRPTEADDPDEWNLLAAMAYNTRSIVVRVEQVPSQALNFADETDNPRSEDEIIAYSYDKFMKNPTDSEWPVLVAMVKSAVKAMDTAQTIVPTLAGVPGGYSIDKFVVTGASKRGWTTWLTAAVDQRVRAIMPNVFDVLNLDEQMRHHYGVYGFFSQAIKDYNDMLIFERILDPEGALLGAIVDPYHYLNNGNSNFDNMPKFVINSAGDEFFVSDSSQYYFDDLPGTENYLRYVPNTGHGLNTDAALTQVAFYNAVLKNQLLPKFSWKVQDDGSIRVTTINTPTTVNLWQATNPIARDFRDPLMDAIGQTWTSTPLLNQGGGVFVGNVPMPASGATAFFVELTYPSGFNFITQAGTVSVPFKFTTHISVKSNLRLYDWLENGSVVGAPLPIDPPPSTSSSSEEQHANELGSVAFAATAPSATIAESVFLPVAAPIVAPVVSASSAVATEVRESALAEALDAAGTASSVDFARDYSDVDNVAKLIDSVFDDDLLNSELEDLLECL